MTKLMTLLSDLVLNLSIDEVNCHCYTQTYRVGRVSIESFLISCLKFNELALCKNF